MMTHKNGNISPSTQKTINTRRNPQQLFDDPEGEEDEEEWEEEMDDPNRRSTNFKQTQKSTRSGYKNPIISPVQENISMGNTFNTVSQFPKQQEPVSQNKITVQQQQQQQQRPLSNQPSLSKQFTLIREEDESLEQSFPSYKKTLHNAKNQQQESTKFTIQPMKTLEVPQTRIDLPIEQYIKQQDLVDSNKRDQDQLNRTMVFRKSMTEGQQENLSNKELLNPPYKRQGESQVYKVVINSVVDASLDQVTLKKRESFEFNIPPQHQPDYFQEDQYYFNSQDGSIMNQTKTSFLNIPVNQSEIADTPRTIKKQGPSLDYFQQIDYLNVEQNQYAILHGSQNDNKIQKHFGVYQFDNDQPVIDKKPQRLIERLSIKQEIEGSHFRKRSIPGGAGLQIVFQNNSNKLLWGYLSRADRLELQKLFKLSQESQLIRNFRDLGFNQPFPFTQAKESRSLSPLYIAVATGSLECLKILFDELINVDIEDGIDIWKKTKDENDLGSFKNDKSRKKRSPLQLACALGLHQIVEFLLQKGANPNGQLNSQQDFQNFGCNVNLQNREKMTPLCKICNRKYKQDNQSNEDKEQKELEIVETLLIVGNSKLVYCCNLNPVLESIKNQKYQIAKYLAYKGGDVNWRGPHTPSCVQIAVDQNNPILLKEILNWPKLDPIDFYYVDQLGKNIFHRIAEKQNSELFVRIVESTKFNPAMIFKYINEPIQNLGFETLPVIICCPLIELAEIYIRFGARVDNLPFTECFNLLSSDNSRFLEFLIKEGGLNINEQDQEGKTALIRASEQNDLRKMQFLLRLGADPDTKYQDDFDQRLGMTLLHDACLKGEVDKARILLQYGANFNNKCLRGRTTLDFLKTNHQKKSNRRKEEIKALLYKYTVKNSILNR